MNVWRKTPTVRTSRINLILTSCFGLTELKRFCVPQKGMPTLRTVTQSLLNGSSYHRSITPKFVTPIAPSCIDNSWRSTTLSPPKKLTSPTANLGWCHVHFIRDSYSTFIHRVIGPSKNSMKLFFNAKFNFKSTWNRDSTTSHHKHPVCQSPAGDAEKLNNVWSRYFGTNRIIDNCHRCLGVMWRKRKNYFDK